MAGSTWTWNGGSAAASTSNWTLTSGPGNANHHPQNGDTAIIADGTVVSGLDPAFQGNTIEIGGTAGTIAVLTVSGDGFSNFGTPGADGTTLITNTVPGHVTPGIAVLNAGGTFINEGKILADGPAGSVFTIDVAPTLGGTATLPGYFFNAGTIEAETGNTLIINIGSGSALFNTGSIVADGGTVVVNVAPGAIAGGDAPVRGFEVIEGGGTLITAASYPASDGNNGTHAEYIFGDSTPHNTLKIENISGFGGVIVGFSAGDTIDLGTLLTVGTLAYSTATSFLSLEAANGTTLATLDLGNFGTGLATGSFPVIDGVANGITIGVGADGDTVLTTSGTLLKASGISGAWQSGASWLGDVVPGTTASASIGLGASAPFTLTTGSTPVSVGGLNLFSALATVKITSNTTLTTGQANDYSGTLDIAAGSTLTGGSVQLYGPSASFTIAAGATADLSGRINANLEPMGGIWTNQPGGNSYAFGVSAGTVVIDGALLAGPPTAAGGGGNSSIGYDSAGQPATVIVNAGGTVTDTHTTIGSDLTSSGTLILDGRGASWTDEINNADTYNSRGNMTVGYNDLISDIPAGLPDPGPVAAAELVVENGATLTEQAGASIANTASSAGNVTVESGGLWSIGTPGTGEGISVGAGGSGTLSVLNGGSVAIYTGGTFISNGTTRGGGGIGIGQTAGATGTVIVSGPDSQLSSQDGAAVGQAGQGLLEVLNGGTVLVISSGIGIGQTAGVESSGTVIVGGTGAAAFLDFGTAAGGLTVGNASQGTLIVDANGTINLGGTGGIAVGQSLGASGVVTVDGPNAVISFGTSASGIGVGEFGDGILNVLNGGTISQLSAGHGITAGVSAGSSGTVTVSGSGALITLGTATSGINIGAAGQGLLNVLGHGTVVTGNGLIVGSVAGVSGTVVVSGAGSELINNSSTTGVRIGPSGAGTLLVQSGGSVFSIGNLVLGGVTAGPQGGAGSASLTGGSRAQTNSSLYVWAGSALSLDSSSGIDVGTTGGYVAGAIDVENGHSLIGNGLIAASVVNNGLIEASTTVAPSDYNAGTLVVAGSVTGTGAIDVVSGAIIQLDGPVAATQAINFSGTGNELILDTPGSGFANAITGLALGDKIEFGNGMTITSASVVNVDTIVVDFHGSNGVSGTYDLTNVAFAPGANAQLSWGTDFSTGDADIQVSPVYLNWTGGFGTGFGTASNWQGDTVPNATDAVSFINNPGTVTGAGTVLSLGIGTYNAPNSGTWTFAGADITVLGQPSAPYLPYAIAVNADTVLNGGILNASGGDTNIGNLGGVTVTAEGGAKVTTLGDSVGTNNGQSGSLVLTGAGTDWIELGGTPVNGSYPGFVNFGFNGAGNGAGGSSGYLIVTNGASLVTGGYATLAGGNGAGSFGTAAISAGGAWTINTGLTVGGGGTGTLAVNGGSVTNNGYTEIGQQTGSSGTVSVNDGTFTAASGFTAGGSGAGTINVGAGGTFLFGGTYNKLGYGYGSSGSLNITNAGTALDTTPGGADFGLIAGGNGGTGTLGAEGGIDVSGAGSLLNLGDNGLVVGSYGGSGGLFVTQSGTVDAGVTNTNGSDAALSAGYGTGGNGVILVSGTHSALNLMGGVGLGSGGSATLVIADDGAVDITNAPTVSNGGLNGLGIGNDVPGGPNIGGEAQVTVTTGGTLSILGGFTAGGGGASGMLDVNDGGTVLAGTGFTVGSASETNGTIYGGTGSVNIGAGGTVLVTEAPQLTNYGVNIGTDNSDVGGPTGLANGAVTVSGAGALLDTSNNGIAVGQLSNGVLTIGQGATVETGTANSTDIAALSVGRQGTGSVVVSSGTLVADGETYIGRAGTGDLLVENNGSVIVGLDGTGNMASGTLHIGGAGYSSGTLLYVGGLGSMHVESGGTVSSALPISVGSDGTNGNLSINSGVVETSQKIFIGNSTTAAAGDQIIMASGTTTLSSATLEAGDGSVEIGPGGTLISTLLNQGSDTTGTSSIIIGQGPGTTGDVTVEGAGALLSSGDNRLGVGDSGDGILTIGQGGSVFAESSGPGNPAMYIGGNDVGPGTGAVTVTDPGSSLTAAGQLNVGYGGDGSLLVENQASVLTQGLDINTTPGKSGDVTVTGTQSLLSNTGRFIVGDAGLGSLSIQSGGTVITTPGTVAGLAGAVIANTASASGSSVTVTGTGSAWRITGTLQVGDAGAGALSVTNGASVTAAALDAGILDITTEGTGQITLSGPNAALTVTGNATVGDAGSANLSIVDGATFAAANLTIGAQGTGSGAVFLSDAGSVLDITGTLNVGTALGVGELTIGPSATVIASKVVLQGEVVNEGGLLDPNEIDVLPGAALVVLDGGSNGGIGDIIVNDYSIEAKSGTKPSQKIETLIGTIVGSFGTLSGTGLLVIDNASTLALVGGPVDASQSVEFAANTGALVVGDIAGFQAIVTSFAAGDTIIVDTPGPATFSQTGSIISVIENGVTAGVLSFATPQAAQTAFVTPDALVDSAMCFLAGTLITTPSGQTAVEQLAQGDLVLTAGGRVRPVVWVGHGRVLATRGRRTAATPVIVRKGALGPNLPHADLRVTKGHSLLLDGVLIPVEFLVNHRSILWDDRAQEVSIYHVELETHDVLLANGAAAESYRDDGNRWLFQNANAGWDRPAKAPYAPVLTGGPVVDAAWRRLLDACGPRPNVPLTDQADLHLMVDGVRVDAVTRTGDVSVFALSTQPGDVCIVSRAAAPQEIGVASDPRCLGVAVRRVVVRLGTRFRVVGGDDPLLADGFHAFEPGTGMRWTNGDATLPAAIFAGFPGRCEVVVQLNATATYIDDGALASVA